MDAADGGGAGLGTGVLRPVGTGRQAGRQGRCGAEDAGGLAHDRIVHLGMAYVERGYITQDEYENLRVYLYEPYEKMGGNGSARRVMLEVDKLPVHKM